jgi:hypothetical protein
MDQLVPAAHVLIDVPLYPLRSTCAFAAPIPASSRATRANVCNAAPVTHHRKRPTTCLVAHSSTTRRALVLALAALALSRPTAPARADRTGKFSTKLTAKRRYLPRIVSGLEALRSLGAAVSQANMSADWTAAVAEFVAGPAKDMKPAMALFTTSYFSEGNRIGQTERQLKQVQAELYQAIDALEKASKAANEAASVAAYALAVGAANDYIATANLKDMVLPLNPSG